MSERVTEVLNPQLLSVLVNQGEKRMRDIQGGGGFAPAPYSGSDRCEDLSFDNPARKFRGPEKLFALIAFQDATV